MDPLFGCRLCCFLFKTTWRRDVRRAQLSLWEEPLGQTPSLQLPVTHYCLWISLLSFNPQASTLAGGSNTVELTNIGLGYSGDMK